MTQQPFLHLLGLVGGVVVTDQMQIQPGGHGLIDGLEEPQELLAAVSAVVLGDDRTTADIERGEQAGRAVPDVGWVILAGVPGMMGRIGAVRSSACIWLFSPTARTSVFSGGLR